MPEGVAIELQELVVILLIPPRAIQLCKVNTYLNYLSVPHEHFTENNIFIFSTYGLGRAEEHYIQETCRR